MKKYLLLLLIRNCTVNTPETLIIHSDPITINQPTQPDKPTTPVYVPIIPDVPTNLTAQSGDGMIMLSWDASANATSYNVYYSNGTFIANTAQTVFNLPIQNGLFAVNYVTANNADGGSVPSNSVSAVAGIIDNHDGTLAVPHLGKIWTKCDFGGWDSATDACISNPPAYQFCTVNSYWACDDTNFLTSGPAFDACASMGIGWHVATKDESIAFGPVYVNYPQGFPGLIPDLRRWTSYAYTPTACWADGYCLVPLSRLNAYPVRCVK